MSTMTQTSELENFTASWSESIANFPNTDVARETMSAQSFPSTRNEHWKYTRLNKISKTVFAQDLPDFPSNIAPTIDELNPRLVFINGRFAEGLSTLPSLDGLEVNLLSTTKESKLDFANNEDLFVAMNTLHASEGVQIQVAKNKQVERPVEFFFLQTGDKQTTQVRHQINIETGANAHFIFRYESQEANDCFTNAVMEMNVGANAHLHIDKLQLENETSRHIGREFVDQAADSTFTINTFTLNGLLTRNDLNIAVSGQNCETNLNGVQLGKGNMHIDNHTVVDHKVSNCESNELYKSVMDGKSTAVFNGKVFVRKDAQKINAFQSNGNVLLSDSATVNSKPELEIYADDVKCSHGSTTGQLDDEAIFYLKARGISEDTAKKMMVAAFVGEVLENHMPSEAVYNFLLKKLEELYGWSF